MREEADPRRRHAHRPAERPGGVTRRSGAPPLLGAASRVLGMRGLLDVGRLTLYALAQQLTALLVRGNAVPDVARERIPSSMRTRPVSSTRRSVGFRAFRRDRKA
ncbi:hypothetical protein ACSRUE_21330 [Sorangium sp. KYC3313]|uniref:hypothetical protein n=1 Tax=Sorangium sp. KYC3313 TaxID=3449740 RepID=UPI003F88FD42